MKTTYKVDGMTCGGCAAAVTRALKARDPAAEVEVDLDAGTVSVDGSEDEAGIGEAVEDAGFDFGGRI